VNFKTKLLRHKALPIAVAVRYDRRIAKVVISLSSGVDISFPLKLVQGLEEAKLADLTDAQISPSGLGVHFPKLDADLYIPALLDGFLGSRRWMAAKKAGHRSVALGGLFVHQLPD
jgi:hypothetical protein